jgi:hypothetical protein
MATAKTKPRTKQWSQHIHDTSDALSLEQGVFSLRSPKRIAESLRRSAEQSRRRKAGPFQSAMSMLNYYINRAGKSLPEKKRTTLEKAKNELRLLYGKELKAE